MWVQPGVSRYLALGAILASACTPVGGVVVSSGGVVVSCAGVVSVGELLSAGDAVSVFAVSGSVDVSPQLKTSGAQQSVTISRLQRGR